MCILAAPMLGLYVISIAIAWFVHPKQRKAERREERDDVLAKITWAWLPPAARLQARYFSFRH